MRDKLIAPAVAATTTAMREYHHAASPCWHHQLALQGDCPGVDLHLVIYSVGHLHLGVHLTIEKLPNLYQSAVGYVSGTSLLVHSAVRSNGSSARVSSI